MKPAKKLILAGFFILFSLNSFIQILKMKLLISIVFLFLFSSLFSQEQFSVFFDSNKFDLKKAEIKKLNDWISKNSLVKVIGVYGFCDEDGSTGFNDTLAKKRIDYVFNSINTRIKFREDFKSRSFGELNNTSKIKSENRKVTLFFIQPKDFARENEIIGVKKIEIKSVNSSIVRNQKKSNFQICLFLKIQTEQNLK